MKARTIVLGGVGIVVLGTGIYLASGGGKKAAEITAFEWSPDNENWERLNGAVINVGAWFLKMSWKNNLDTEIYYLGRFTWNGESKAGDTFALANGESALTLTGSGLPGLYHAEASLAGIETGEVIDSVKATFTVI